MIKSYEEFPSYLAGLLEGNGTIFVPKPGNGLINIKSTPKFEIRFSSNPLELKFLKYDKDFSLNKKIKKVLDFGKIRKIKNKNNYILKVNTTEGVLNLIEILNGKFRTPKIKKFYTLIEYINKNKNLNISLLPIDNSNLLSNAWLAGYLDVDSSQGNRETNF